jgi:hypothetical protein
MKPFFLLCCCWVGWAAPLQSQEAFVWQQTLPHTYTDFEVDNLGKLYLIDSNQRIKKLSEAFDSVGVFNEVRSFGTLHSIDVSNPLRVILWYKDFATLVILDRFLNLRTSIDLRRIGILQCNAIGQSYDNNIWLYDDIDSKVKKINEEGNTLMESADFRIWFEDPPHPNRLEDFNKLLYAYDSSRGLLVMDYYGAYQKILSYTGWRFMQGHARGLMAITPTELIFVPADFVNTRTAKLPPDLQQAKKIRIQGKRLFALSPAGRLSVYFLPNSFETQ